MRDGVATIPTTLIIRSCYIELVYRCDCYSFHLCSTEPDLLQSEYSDRSVSSSTEQRLLVSGVEEIDASPEDPIVQHSSPVPRCGISGRDSLLVVSFVTSRKIFHISFVCHFLFRVSVTSYAYFLAYFRQRNYFIKNPIFVLLKYPGEL